MPQYDFWRQPYSKEQLAAAADNMAPSIDAATKNWKVWDIANMAWVDTGIPTAGKNPYIGNDHYWYVWDAAANQYVNTGYSVAQDAVQNINGVFADATGTVSLGWTNFSGALPANKGGTNATSVAGALYNLIHGPSSLDHSTLAGSDKLGVSDESAETGKQVSVNDFITYIVSNSGLAKIVSGTYTGDGTTDRVISLGFNPQAVIVCRNNGAMYASAGSSSNVSYGGIALPGYPCIFGTNNAIEIVTGGFMVTNNGSIRTNYTDASYYYIATR